MTQTGIGERCLEGQCTAEPGMRGISRDDVLLNPRQYHTTEKLWYFKRYFAANLGMAQWYFQRYYIRGRKSQCWTRDFYFKGHPWVKDGGGNQWYNWEWYFQGVRTTHHLSLECVQCVSNPRVEAQARIWLHWSTEREESSPGSCVRRNAEYYACGSLKLWVMIM